MSYVYQCMGLQLSWERPVQGFLPGTMLEKMWTLLNLNEEAFNSSCNLLSTIPSYKYGFIINLKNL